MPNPHGKPPVPDGSNPLQGLAQSKIDFYNLGHIVKKLRNTPGVSLIDITNELNEKYLPEDAKISVMAVSRYCNKHVKDDIDLRCSEEMAINIYGEEVDMLNIITEEIETIQIYLNQFKSEVKKGSDVTLVAGKVKDLLFLLDKLIARKGAILANIGNTQEKIYNYVNMNNIITIVLDEVKNKDLTLYADIVEKIKSNPMLIEMYKKIRPEK
jgi:hypothetical protein